MIDREARLAEAVAARVAASASGDTVLFVAAFARERRIRELIEGGREFAYHFDPGDHPRDRVGQFVDVLARLKVGHEAVLPRGITVFRKSGHYKIVGKGGSNLGRTRSAEAAAAAALSAHDAPATTIKLNHPPVMKFRGLLGGKGKGKIPAFGT